MTDKPVRPSTSAVVKQAFQGLDGETVEMLRRVAVRRSYPPGTALCREGEPADTFYLITNGRVAVTRDLKGTDQDFLLALLGPGQYFGEMAVITEEPRACTGPAILGALRMSCWMNRNPGWEVKGAMFAMSPESRLSTQMTRWPSFSIRSQRAEPRNPAPPATRTTFSPLELPVAAAGPSENHCILPSPC